MSLNTAKIQVIFKIPLSFQLANVPPYVGDIVQMVFDRGASSWLAAGTKPSDGHFIACRGVRTTYDELTDVLNRYPELPFEILQAQSFTPVAKVDMVDGEEVVRSEPEVYRQATAETLLPFMADVVEYDDEGNEAGRKAATEVSLSPSVMGATKWVFG